MRQRTATNVASGMTTSTKETFADDLSFMKADFSSKLEKISKEQEAAEEQAKELRKVKGVFGKSMGEF